MSERAGRGPDTWMPLYIGDYLADTLHLTAELHGAYLLMLMHAWRNGGAIPDDDPQLAAIAKLDGSKWRKAKPVLARFFQVEGGEWRQKRLNAELAAAIETQQKKQAAGKAGAAARYKQNDADTTAVATAVATADATADATGNRMADAQLPQWQTHTPSPSPKNTPPLPPSADAEGGTNGHDLLGEQASGTRRKRRADKRGLPAEVPMPDGWEPDDDAKTWTHERLRERGLSDAWAWEQLDSMRDYARQHPAWRHADWNATWRNWVRKALERRAQ